MMVSRQIGMIFGVILLMVSLSWAVDENEYVDTHVHLRGTVKSGMLGNSAKPMSLPDGPNTTSAYLRTAAECLIKQMDHYGVRHALVVVVPGVNANEDEYQSMRGIVSQYPDRLKLMAGGARLSPFFRDIDPRQITEADRLRFRELAVRLLREGATGFGEMIAYHLSMANHHPFHSIPPDHPFFMLLADIAAENNAAIDLHMEAIVDHRAMPENLRRASRSNPEFLEPTIPAFERLLAHNRKARIVWQHVGWDNTGDMTAELLTRLMSAHSNLNIALRVENRVRQVGNGPMMPNRLVDETGKIMPIWLALIRQFPDRITIGSDEFFFPVPSSNRPNQSFEKTWSLLDQLPTNIAKKIGHDNPKQIYGLDYSFPEE